MQEINQGLDIMQTKISKLITTSITNEDLKLVHPIVNILNIIHKHLHKKIKKRKLEDLLNQFIHVSMSIHKNTEASIKTLETQDGQLAKQLENILNKTLNPNNMKIQKSIVMWLLMIILLLL